MPLSLYIIIKCALFDSSSCCCCCCCRCLYLFIEYLQSVPQQFVQFVVSFLSNPAEREGKRRQRIVLNDSLFSFVCFFPHWNSLTHSLILDHLHSIFSTNNWNYSATIFFLSVIVTLHQERYNFFFWRMIHNYFCCCVAFHYAGRWFLRRLSLPKSSFVWFVDYCFDSQILVA